MSLKEEMAELRALLADARATQGVHQIMMQSPDSGERAAHKAEKIAIGLAGLLVGLLIGGWSLVSRMADDARDLRREQQRTSDYLNMLWRAYPETREAALKAQEDRKNGKPDHH